MAPPRLGVHLGEYQGKSSLVVYSAKGVQHSNVHPELQKILSGLQAVDILDLALGCRGQYYIKYRSGTTEKRAISFETWVTIQKQFSGTIQDVSRIYFGKPGEFWAVVEENARSRQLLQVRKQVSDILLPRNAPHPAVKDITFLALGKYDDHFVVKIGNKVTLGGHGGVRGKSPQDLAKKDRMIAVAFSPNDGSNFFVMFDDGSSRMSVEKKFGKIFKPHLKSRVQTPQAAVSTLTAAAPAVQASPLYTEPQIFTQDDFKVPPCTGSCTTQLRLMDWFEPDYRRVQTLFHNGWKHPRKTIPWLRYMYEIRLPVPLLMTYCTYRRKMSLTRDLATSTEYELFHGTGRQCMLGNEPQLNKLCKDPNCRMCRILTISFAVNKAGSAPGRNFLRFGHGIYTSSVSSKADDYTATPRESKFRAMLVARVVLGNGYPLKLTTQHLTGPPTGYDSVIGQVGLHLNYDEQVIYNEDAVRPAYLIIYKH